MIVCWSFSNLVFLVALLLFLFGKKTKTLNLSVQHFFVFKWLIVFLSNLWLCQPLQVTFGSYQAFRKAAAMPATATEHPILCSEQYRRFYDSKKKLTLKTYFFCEVKQLYLVQVFDFETVPALPRSSGPPRPSGKRRQRRQPRTYIKLSGQTSTKVNSSSSRIWLEKNIHYNKNNRKAIKFTIFDVWFFLTPSKYACGQNFRPLGT